MSGQRPHGQVDDQTTSQRSFLHLPPVICPTQSSRDPTWKYHTFDIACAGLNLFQDLYLRLALIVALNTGHENQKLQNRQTWNRLGLKLHRSRWQGDERQALKGPWWNHESLVCYCLSCVLGFILPSGFCKTEMACLWYALHSVPLHVFYNLKMSRGCYSVIIKPSARQWIAGFF